MPDSFTCTSCGEVLPAYLSDDRCPVCRVEVGPPDADTAIRIDDVTLRPTSNARQSKPLPSSEFLDREFGDYQLLSEIARGGMGVVYRARHQKLDRIVALKMILDGQLASDVEVDRFRIEAQAAANLDHPNIVPVYDTGEHDGRHFFSMALIEGESLRDRIAAGPLPQQEAARILQKVANAIDYAHQRRIIHRDLKPDNILLDQEGSPRITDFGLAKKIDSRESVTVTGQTLGTPSYMSPEQAGGKTNVAESADIYALGAVLYAMLCGKPPFSGESLVSLLTQVMEREPVGPREINPEVSIDLETICLKCLEKHPQDRYETARDLEDELLRFLNDEPIKARPLKGWQQLMRWRRIVARNKDVRLRSSKTIFGLPLVDIAYGRDSDNDEVTGSAKGIFAFGDKAVGLAAFGNNATGLFAYGLVAKGLFVIGGLAIGVMPVGAISLGVFSFGGLSIGAITASGLICIGYYSLGFVAIGPNPMGAFIWKIFGSAGATTEVIDSATKSTLAHTMSIMKSLIAKIGINF